MEEEHSTSGFSLIEMSLMLVILGILGGVLIPRFVESRRQWQRETTRVRMERVLYALGAFFREKKRLPCPGDSSEAHRFGSERMRCQAPHLAQGDIPFRTLGLSEEAARDGAGGFMTYVVHPQLTFMNALQDGAERLSCVIRIRNEDSGQMDGGEKGSAIAVVLVAHHQFRAALSRRGSGRQHVGDPVLLKRDGDLCVYENTNNDFLLCKGGAKALNQSDVLCFETYRNFLSYYARYGDSADLAQTQKSIF